MIFAIKSFYTQIALNRSLQQSALTIKTLPLYTNFILSYTKYLIEIEILPTRIGLMQICSESSMIVNVVPLPTSSVSFNVEHNTKAQLRKLHTLNALTFYLSVSLSYSRPLSFYLFVYLATFKGPQNRRGPILAYFQGLLFAFFAELLLRHTNRPNWRAIVIAEVKRIRRRV